MTQPGVPARRLAERLRELRMESSLGVRITQPQLAKALDVSVPLISSWESVHSPKVPPEERLGAYATFFATEKSVEREPYRLVDLADLTEAERERRGDLLEDLRNLRNLALGSSAVAEPGAQSGSLAPGSLLHFPDGKRIVVVCAPLPAEMRAAMPYSQTDSPDYDELYGYADLSPLIELHGHLRAVNPNSPVTFKTTADLLRDDLAAHLVLLGGVDWNAVTRDLFARLSLPVGQARRVGDEDVVGFEVKRDGETVELRPTVVRSGDSSVLLEDVALFFHGTNPYNSKRTITLFSGMFAAGTLGVVRAQTDANFRDRNGAYLRERFGGAEDFCLISRVAVLNGTVVTPDWAVQDNVLYTWPEGVS